MDASSDTYSCSAADAAIVPRLPTSNAIWKEQESESDSLILEVKMEVFAYGDQHCAKMI
eukprot:m.256805 g.256805  ORF g.256805 m.256805 type:complete len:59 (+) comp26578_c0_seq12:3720-3896(+)